MKLLYITNGINGSGGLERVLSIKASYLTDKLDYQVHILVLNNAHQNPFYGFSSKISFYSIDVKGNPFYYFLQYKNGIKRIISRVQPDVISVCDDGFKGLLFPILFRSKIPFIYERHASFEIFRKEINANRFQQLKLFVSKPLLKWSARKFSRFIVLTTSNLQEWKLPNMLVIPNPLSFYPTRSAQLENKKVIAVGNHGFQKGFDRLLLCWKGVITKHPDWQLEIYGKKDPNKKLENLIKEYRLSKHVQLFDPVNNIEEKYLDASIFALSSRSEGFGMVLIEAMACGVPCVAFDCPSGPKDIISHQKDGILVKNEDIEAFDKAILTLIENKEKRKQMGKLAKENVKRYLPENIMTLWDALFKDLCIPR